MNVIAPIISLLIIAVVARLLLKKYYPHAVLLIAGMLMLVLANIFNLQLPTLGSSTGFSGFDLFAYVKEAFSLTNSGVGLMIMAIGGFVAYIDKIGASDALVKIAMKPLSLLKKYPHITTVAVLPIGQLLFVCIPSAAGLSLLLMASVYPILRNLGVSKISAASVITACTSFGIGPASAISVSAFQIAQEDGIKYFLSYQLPLVLPLCLILMITYYFVNRHFDKIEKQEEMPDVLLKTEKNAAPKIYAIIPILPLILLLVFSEIFSFFQTPIKLDTTTAMLISLFVAIVFEAIRKRNLREVLHSLSTFWNGMGNIFKTVVTLIIAAEIFSKGLIAMGFIDGLVTISTTIGLAGIGIGVIMVCMIFLASMLMGSGNAAFFAFAPLIPKISAQFGIKATSIILPMNLAASMGRTVSPVAGVLIAVADVAGITSIDIVKRNIIPFIVALLFLLVYHFI